MVLHRVAGTICRTSSYLPFFSFHCLSPLNSVIFPFSPLTTPSLTSVSLYSPFFLTFPFPSIPVLCPFPSLRLRSRPLKSR